MLVFGEQAHDGIELTSVPANLIDDVPVAIMEGDAASVRHGDHMPQPAVGVIGA